MTEVHSEQQGDAAVLTKKCSEQVSCSIAEGPEEVQRLMAELPASIRKDLQESLDRERVVLRFDAINRCAYYITREKSALIVWLWCELRARAAGHLLPAIVEANEPMNERLALELYDLALTSRD